MRQDTPVHIRNAGEFFMKVDPVHRALAQITQRLELEGIDYALIPNGARLPRVHSRYPEH
jgi:hypothetical protein